MSTALLEKKFEAMGARVKVNSSESPRGMRRRLDAGRTISIDILRDSEGEYFDILMDEGEAKPIIMDVQKKDRHLLLMARDGSGDPMKFLCGHDERHWFTCAVPSASGIPVSNVLEAKQALKPREVVQTETRGGLKTKDSQKRRRKLKKGGKIIRQGEFMFMPVPDMDPDPLKILKDEPMARGGNPHMAQFLYREGGTRVNVLRVGFASFMASSGVSAKDNSRLRNGLTDSEKKSFIKKYPESKNWPWTIQVRNPTAYVKGKITHIEHSTVDLGDTWHRVAINTEERARGARNIAFID